MYGSETKDYMTMGKIRDNSMIFTYCICGGSYIDQLEDSTPLVCKSCEKWSHRHCTCYDGPDEGFECDLCRVQSLDPFNSVVEFLWYGRVGNKNTAFKVDTKHLDKWLSDKKEVYVVSLPLNKRRLIHEWPRTFELKINKETVHIVKEPNWEHPRRDNPIKVTYAMKDGENLIEMESTTYSDNGPFFVVVFMITKKVSINRMIDNIRKRRTISFEESKGRIIALINSDNGDDDVICMEQNHKIELNCPITLGRISIPARGRNCRHIQCFDLNGYLQVMQNTSNFNTRWKCPECDLIIKPVDLVIDEYVLRILQSTTPSTSTVELDDKGDYKVVGSGRLCYDGTNEVDLVSAGDHESAQTEPDDCYVYMNVSETSQAQSQYESYKVNGVPIEGICVKSEEGHGCKQDHVFDLEHESNSTRNLQSGFRQEEVIIVDVADDDIKEQGDSSVMREHGNCPNVGSTKTTDDSALEEPLHVVKQPALVIMKEKCSQNNGRPKTTLSQRLAQLPRISGSK